jgi:tetratricopeptide (TPR) repeat protein
MSSPRPLLLLFLALQVFSFGLAAHLVPQFQAWRGSRSTGDIFNVVLGDSRRLFANAFFVKADEYYHSGYYPTMFDDNAAFQTAHMAADTGAVNDQNHGDEHGFLGPPRNWLDAFGRHFFPDRHTHLDAGGPEDDLSGSDNVREILPWLKLSADLDPDNVQTYTVTAYWLRERMNNVPEADAILHEGLRNCPDSYDILFELGRLYYESYRDTSRARNVWELGVRKWLKLDPDTQKDNRLIMEQLTTHLGKLEEEAGNLPQAIDWFEMAKTVSLTPDTIQQQQINRLRWQLYKEFNPLVRPLY